MTQKISTTSQWNDLDFAFPAWVRFTSMNNKKDTPQGKMSGTKIRTAIRAVELHNDVEIVGPLKDVLDKRCEKYDLLYGE